MFYFLLERLRKIDEVVATADPQKVMKDYYKGGSTKLVLSTWPSVREQNQYKFWLLQDGTVIPVVYSHARTVASTGELRPQDVKETGAVEGYISRDGEMDIRTDKKLASKQISALRNLAIEYKATSIYAEIGGKDWESPIKSSKHLDYLLNYGPDVDEAKSKEEDETENQC